MKRILSILLASVMLLGCLSIGASAEDIYLKLHVWAYEGSDIPENTDETRTDTNASPDAYRAYVDNEADFKKIVDRIRKVSIEKTSKDIVMLNIVYADQLTLEKFYALYGYDKLIEEYKEKYGEDIPKEDLLSYRSMYRAKIFPYHKAVAERDFEVKFDYISYELSYGFGFPGAKVIVAGDKLTFADVKTLLEDDRVESVSLSTTSSGYVSYPTGGEDSSDPASISFTDIKEGAWYYEHVNNAYSMGLMEGTSETTFEPNATLSRAMLVTIIGRFNERINGTLPESTESVFSDVKAGKWYSDYVAWAAENGVVEGYPDGSFRPDAPVTREEAVTILGRYYNRNIPKKGGAYTQDIITYHPHNDTDEIADWAQDWVLNAMIIGAVDCELFRLDTENPEYYFEPKRSMTRAEAAKVAYVYLSVLESCIERGSSGPTDKIYRPVNEDDLILKEELKQLYQ